jgi:hypothetical protein
MSIEIKRRMERLSSQQRILSVLEDGVRSWDELKGLTYIQEDLLGINIGQLLGLRKIWTAHENDVRVYGIEKRRGLVPRASHQLRRAADRAAITKGGQ